MQQGHDYFASVLKKNGTEVVYTKDMPTHLAKLTGNGFLTEMIAKANLMIHRFLTLSGTLGKYSPTALKEHEAVLAELMNGQPEQASTLMGEHIKNAYLRMLV